MFTFIDTYVLTYVSFRRSNLKSAFISFHYYIDMFFMKQLGRLLFTIRSLGKYHFGFFVIWFLFMLNIKYDWLESAIWCTEGCSLLGEFDGIATFTSISNLLKLAAIVPWSWNTSLLSRKNVLCFTHFLLKNVT